MADRRIQLRIVPPNEDWKVATQLEPTSEPFTFEAENLYYFLDSPTEVSEHELYEWRDGATVVRPADPDPTWSPPTALAGTITYTVVVSCAGPPGCEASDDVTVEVRACALAVRFDLYRAVVQRDGSVLVTWKTLEEDGTLGFVVERAPSSTGLFVAAGDHEARGAGYRYTVRDADVANAVHAWYRIVELTSSGRGDATPAFRPVQPDVGGGSRTRGAAVIGRKR